MLHEITHLLGLCGEPHPSLLYILNEFSALKNLFTWIKISIFRV